MFKYVGGPITNPETGISKGIAATPKNDFKRKNTVIDLCVSAAAIVGIAIHMASKIFNSGARSFDGAELRTLEDLDLLKY